MHPHEPDGSAGVYNCILLLRPHSQPTLPRTVGALWEGLSNNWRIKLSHMMPCLFIVFLVFEE